jgi:hypothetical protein
MRSVKYMTLGVLLALGMFCAALYVSSCSKDACKGVTCLNHGRCNGGNCICVDSGTGGLNCEIVYRLLYTNSYEGNAVVTYSHFDSLALDSGYIAHTDTSNIIRFAIGNDTAKNKIDVTWTDGSSQMMLETVALENNSSTGSTFIILPTHGGPGDSFSISGNGSVSTTSASLSLTAVPAHPNVTPTIYYTLSNCPKQ